MRRYLTEGLSPTEHERQPRVEVGNPPLAAPVELDLRQVLRRLTQCHRPGLRDCPRGLRRAAQPWAGEAHAGDLAQPDGVVERLMVGSPSVRPNLTRRSASGAPG